MFTGAVSHDDDFDAAAKRYYETQSRSSSELIDSDVKEYEITRVRQQAIHDRNWPRDITKDRARCSLALEIDLRFQDPPTGSTVGI